MGSRRRAVGPLCKIFCRKLMPNLEHVTWSDPAVTPSKLAISSRLTPCVTNSLIFSIACGVNFTRLPLPAEGLTFVIVMASFTVVTAHHLSHDFDFGFNHYARGIVSKRLCAGDRAGLAGSIGSLLGSLRAKQS